MSQETFHKLSVDEVALLNKLLPSEMISQMEMQRIVELYVYVRKGHRIKIRDFRQKYANRGLPNNIIVHLIASDDLPKLQLAFWDAWGWFVTNRDKWNLTKPQAA